MAAPDISPFTLDDPDDVSAAAAIREAASVEDSPWRYPETRADLEGWMREGWDGEPGTWYLLRSRGEPVAVGSLWLTESDNTHLADLDVVVHPAHRRSGHGSALHGFLAVAAGGAGRRSIKLDGWDLPAVTGFARSVGLERRSQEILRRQHLAEVDLQEVRRLRDEAAELAADYELVRVAGTTPEGLVAGVVDLMATMNDAPTDDLDVEDEVFSPERLAAYERATSARGNRLYRLLARHRVSGELGGQTVVAVETRRPEVAHQHDTAVARAHRGHRLGLLLKAAMVVWLSEVEPQVQSVDTWNAESNDHMIAVNEALGYRVLGRMLQFQRDV